MGNECTMPEVLKVSDGKGDEFELSLELSIGGCYGKKSKDPNKIEGKTTDPFEEKEKLSRPDFSCGKRDVGGENGYEFVDLQRKRESQVLKGQEARKKREEKLNKSLVSKTLSSEGFTEDKLFLEGQQLQARVQDREMRENDVYLARKRGKNVTDEDGKDLNLSLFKEDKILGASISNQQMQMQCLFPQVQYLPVGNGIAYNVENDRGNRKTTSNGSLEQSSSSNSDYQSTTQKGESGSDTGSHSSPLHSNLHPAVPKRSNVLEHLKSNTSSSIPQLSSSKSCEKSKPDTHSSNTCSTSKNWASPTLKETSAGLVEDPPKQSNNHHSVASVSHMPCVSTTGNGPNAKTIMGFLYKYTKMEVSIMCVCHGSSFTPAEFVEHAGGIDISHPMRHITIVPSAFG